MSIRIGNGYDVHAFAPVANTENKTSSILNSPPTYIMLGATRIPSDRELLAHSDGDVLLHALCDALLGALGLGDIGEHFPDTDESYRNIDSSTLLMQVYDKVRACGYVLGNTDITVVAAKPRLSQHKKTMVANIAALLETPVTAVNVKATTTEGLGPFGRAEGIAVYACVLLTPKVSG